ncbi:MAG: hypothetical protein HFG39_01600 [Lachnospiraceae bacterium]|nr:hypothetical protein [Lachnospiraceae bacterium]
MSDLYSEWIVKRKKPVWALPAKIILILFTAIMAFFAMAGFIILAIPALILGYVTYRLSLNWDLEYEYTFVKGELDIDKIMAKAKRKRCAVFNMEQTEVVAPEGAHQLDNFKNTPCKVMDFSSGIPENKKYIMYTSYHNEIVKVIFEPNDRMLDDMWNTAPRKVVK